MYYLGLHFVILCDDLISDICFVIHVVGHLSSTYILMILN